MNSDLDVGWTEKSRCLLATIKKKIKTIVIMISIMISQRLISAILQLCTITARVPDYMIKLAAIRNILAGNYCV